MIDYDEIALAYARHRQVHPEVLRHLLLTGHLDQATSVLEVGCGTGNYITALTTRVGCSGWGVDPSSQMLAQARKRSDRINFKLGQAESLAFFSEFFDLVFSVDVIHHLDNHLPYFREAYRVLKPGGKVCTTTDSEWIIRHRQPLAYYFPETIEVDLKRYPGLAYLRQVMTQAGFSQIGERTVEFASPLTDIQLYRDRAYSVLHLISAEAFQSGIERMEQDWRTGPIQWVPRYVLLWGTK